MKMVELRGLIVCLYSPQAYSQRPLIHLIDYTSEILITQTIWKRYAL